MIEVTRPTRPRGSILSAVATVSALALFLIFASSALGASESLTGGTTDLTLTKGFKKKLSKNDVKVLGSGSGKVSNGTVELSVSGGEIDTAAGLGSIAHGGGFKLKHGKQTAAITGLTIELGDGAVIAKVANSRMKLGSLGPVSYTRNGVNVNVSSGAVNLTSKAAKRLNKKLGLDNALKGTMSDSQSAVQVKAATPVTPPATGQRGRNAQRAEQRRRRHDDPQPLPGRRPDPGDRRPEPASAVRCRRSDPRRSRTQRLPDPRGGPGRRDPPRNPTWSACRRSPSGARPRPIPAF